MKKLFCMLVCAAFSVCFIASFAVSAAAEEVTEASSVPVIDGLIDDIWFGIPVHEIKNVITGTDPVSADYRTLWSKTFLYVLVRVFDTDVSYTGDVAEHDGVSFWLNPSNITTDLLSANEAVKVIVNAPADSSIQYAGSLTAISDFSRAARKAYVKTDYGYLIEASFDLSALAPGYDGSSGTTFGFDIWVTNQDSATGKVSSVTSAFSYTAEPGSTLIETLTLISTVSPSVDGEQSSDQSGSTEQPDDIPGTSDRNFFCLAAIIASLTGIFALSIGKRKD